KVSDKQTEQASKPQAKPSTSTSKTYKVVKSIAGYVTAADAKARKNKKTTVKPNTYHVYKESNGMINVSAKKGSPGSWINPADNKNLLDQQANRKRLRLTKRLKSNRVLKSIRDQQQTFRPVIKTRRILSNRLAAMMC